MPVVPPSARLRQLAAVLCLGMAAQGAIAQETAADHARPRPRPNADVVRAAGTDSPAGAYLAARAASASNDFAAAVTLFQRALALDPANPALLDGAIVARLATGDIAGAAQAARAMGAAAGKSQAAILALVAADAQAGDFAAVKTDLSDGRSIGQMSDALILAWAELGQGSMSDALAAFDKLGGTSGTRSYAMYHKALALALSGDFEGADKILSGPEIGPIRQTRRALVARVEVLAQLDRRPEALALLDSAFPAGSDPVMDALRAHLTDGGSVAFDVVTSPLDGLTEALFNMATALTGQADAAYVLVFARTAAALRPDHVEAVMLSAQLFLQLGQQGLAAEAYALIPPTSPAFVDAAIGRADAALQAKDAAGAVTILTGLASAHPRDAAVARALADALRRDGRLQDAVAEYDRAVGLAGTLQASDWVLFYARGITLYELDRWPEAEADFRKALELRPDQPQVLNYLGYSYVDRGENLEEALKMIQRAVLAAPDQGYIVDSLAWALYRLGRVQEAVVPMERASQLEPIDPIVTDHLGDVYWAVGRKMEAQFQWRRALSFHPTEKDAVRIRRKLDVGLDQVLEDEKSGALPAPTEQAPTEQAPAEPPAPTDANGG